MVSKKSTRFHLFCRRWLPFLLIRCPIGNFHYRWRRQNCTCGAVECFGGHHKNTYHYIGKGWWHRHGTEIAIRDAEVPHPHLCVHHGGSPQCEELNTAYNHECPKCKRIIRNNASIIHWCSECGGFQPCLPDGSKMCHCISSGPDETEHP